MLNCHFLKIPTCKDNDVDVIFSALKLVRDTQVTVNIFLSQAGDSPIMKVDKNIYVYTSVKKGVTTDMLANSLLSCPVAKKHH